jgi:signal transduction histidine kinase
MTARIQAEQALRESEHRLAESEAELRALAEQLITTQEESLRQLGRELHDDISQRLAALAMELDTFESSLDRRQRTIRTKLRKLAETTMRLADDVHSLSRQLHPSTLTVLGLPVALEAECARLRGADGMNVEFHHADLPHHIPPNQALTLYRIAQEGLRNVARHARAETVRVDLAGANGGLELRISDNGGGFDRRAVRGKGGLGLVSMEERARLAGGTLKIDSAVGRGTTLTVKVPLLRPTDVRPRPARA